MVHNGIEYGMMQAYAEGFGLMEKKTELGLDLGQIAEIWRHGSVVRSWLLDLAKDALKEDPKLEHVKGVVEDSGEGRWTIQQAVESGVPRDQLGEGRCQPIRDPGCSGIDICPSSLIALINPARLSCATSSEWCSNRVRIMLYTV